MASFVEGRELDILFCIDIKAQGFLLNNNAELREAMNYGNRKLRLHLKISRKATTPVWTSVGER